MKSWRPLCLVNGLILAVVARLLRIGWSLRDAPSAECMIWIEIGCTLIGVLISGNLIGLKRYRRACLRNEAFRRRVEREQIYSEPYTWFRRDPNPEPLRNEEG